MREWAVTVSCDVHFAEDGEKVEAWGDPVLLKIGKAEVELDLCAVHRKELDMQTAVWLKAGRRPGQDSRPHRSHRRQSNEYYRKMREFAAERDITIPEERPGKFKYPTKLRADFEAWLATVTADGSDH